MNKGEFESEIKNQIEKFESIFKSMPWNISEFYSLWCAQTYKYVCHSAPLIKKTAEHLPAGQLKTEMQKHYKEEVGHEKFALRDAAHFGLDADAIETLPETSKMFEYANKEIETDPAAMYGYAFALEHISKVYAPIVAELVAKSFDLQISKIHTHNVPVSFLTLHAEVDQEHADHGLEALDHLPESSHPFAMQVMKDTFDNYHSFLEAVKSNSENGVRNCAAG